MAGRARLGQTGAANRDSNCAVARVHIRTCFRLACTASLGKLVLLVIVAFTCSGQAQERSIPFLCAESRACEACMLIDSALC